MKKNIIDIKIVKHDCETQDAPSHPSTPAINSPSPIPSPTKRKNN